MHRDFLRDLGFLGVTARLKRLSEALSASIKDLYGAVGVDLEPSWHLVLLILKDRTATLTELAAALDLSPPAVTKMVRRMVDKGYLVVEVDEQDGRKRNIGLSMQARERLPGFERVWTAGRTAVRDILGSDTTFLAGLDAFENQVRRRSFKERALQHLGGEGAGSPVASLPEAEGRQLEDRPDRLRGAEPWS